MQRVGWGVRLVWFGVGLERALVVSIVGQTKKKNYVCHEGTFDAFFQ